MWKDVLGHCHGNLVELRIQLESTKWFINLLSLFFMSVCERAVNSSKSFFVFVFSQRQLGSAPAPPATLSECRRSCHRECMYVCTNYLILVNGLLISSLFQQTNSIHREGSAPAGELPLEAPMAAAVFFTRGKVDRLRAALLTLHDGEMRDNTFYTFLWLLGFLCFFCAHHRCLFSRRTSGPMDESVQQTTSHWHHITNT